MNESKKRLDLRRVSSAIALAALSGMALATPQFQDELDRCNNDNGQAALKSCLDAAVVREHARQADQELKKKRDDEARVRGAEAQRKKLAASAPEREELRLEYSRLLHDIFPNLNFITVRPAPAAGGMALMGEHSMFGRYTFDVGGAGPAVQRWVGKNAPALRRAGITQVGVRSPDGGKTAFVVP